MKFLPANVHNVLDYVVGLVLILVPNIFSFTDAGAAANWVPRIIGIASILMGLTTAGYKFSLLKLIPLKMHMTVDFLAGVVLVISPFVFSFTDQGANAWVPLVVAGVALIGVSLVTQTTSGENSRAAA